jgi:hypothetical protein
MVNWNIKLEVNEYYKEYNAIPINKEKRLKRQKEYRLKNSGYHTSWNRQNSGKVKINNTKYRKSIKGKLTSSRHCAKRQRHYGFIPMFENPFDDSVEIEWHHINNCYVVAIPKDLHKLYSGKYHREKVMNIVKQLYLNI